VGGEWATSDKARVVLTRMGPPVPGARRLPELHKRSARPENCQRPTERVCPDGVENSCHAIACGERERFGDEVFGGILMTWSQPA